MELRARFYKGLLGTEEIAAEGGRRIYAFPREGDCVSTQFLGLMNYFGNLGGFDAILAAIYANKEDVKGGSSGP